MNIKQDKVEYIAREQKQLEKSARFHWLHWLVLIGSLAITLGAWYFTKQQIQEKTQLNFDRQSQQLVDQIFERMRKYEDALWGGVAAINSQSFGIDRKEWRRFSEGLNLTERYPGINGIGVIRYVSNDQLEGFLASERGMMPDFSIHPEHDRGELWPIVYIEPEASNYRAIGLDMAHEDNRYSAAVKARDTGKAQITAPIVLVQDAEKTPGFLFFAPYYKGNKKDTLQARQENFAGMVYAPFIMNKLLEGTLDKTRRQVNIKVSDNDHVLYDEHVSSNSNYDADPLLTKTIELEEYGRYWTIEIQSGKSFKQSAKSNQPVIILGGGILIDALLFMIFLVLSRSNRRAMRFGMDMASEYRQKLDEVAEKEERLRTIVDNIEDGFLTMTNDGVVESYNPACETILGHTSLDAIGKNIVELIPELSQKLGAGKGAEKLRHIVGEVETIKIKPKNNKDVYVELSISKASLDNRDIYSALIRDITDEQMMQMQLDDAKSFQDLVIKIIPSLVFVKDSEYKIVQANDSFMSLYPEDMQGKIIGHTTVEEYEEKDAKLFLENDRIALEEGYHETIETVKFPDGQIRTLLTKKTAFNSGGKKFLLGVSHDITEIKEAEEEILRSNLELERFAYIASHDLQEPLRMVSNFTALLNDEYGENLDETGQQYMRFITDSSARMQEMINDLLEYSRLGQEEVGYGLMDPARSLEQAKENLTESIQSTEATITADELPEIYCIPMRFMRLLQNLIGNSIKYRDESRAPEIHVSCEERKHDYLFCVSDNGIGMREEYLDQIFVLFKRLHNKNEYSGTGIGLAICQKIVESFRGQIYATSELGKGSKFFFTVPKQDKENENG